MLVTDNIKDFCATKGKLHDALAEEVAAMGSLPVETVRNLNAAVQHLKDVEQLDTEPPLPSKSSTATAIRVTSAD